MISIIVPVYNAGKYFEECVESVLKQTYNDWELILIDDGSTDGTREKCDNYSKSDNRIKTIYSNRGGVSRARNIGIDSAKGDYLFFMDNDDYWKEDTLLENVIQQIKVQNADIMMYSCITFWPDGRTDETVKDIEIEKVNSNDKASSIKYIVQKDILTRAVWTKAIKRDLFSDNNIRFPEGMRNEDVDVTGKLLLYSKKIGWCDNATYMYRKGTGISQSDQQVSDQTILDMKEICIDFIDTVDAKDISSELRTAYYSYIAYPFAVLMMYIGGTKNKQIKKECTQLKKYAKVLKADYNPYVKFINKAYKILGFKNTIRLLSIYNKIRK